MLTMQWQEICTMQYQTIILSPELTYDQQLVELWTDAKFRKQISCIIMEEAHCISTWGRSFHSAYLKLRTLHLIFQNEVQWYLTSMTMSTDVLQDVISIIDLPSKVDVYHWSNDRPDIHLVVHTTVYTLCSHFDLACQCQRFPYPDPSRLILTHSDHPA